MPPRKKARAQRKSSSVSSNNRQRKDSPDPKRSKGLKQQQEAGIDRTDAAEEAVAGTSRVGLEVVFCIDATMSMYDCFKEVKQKVTAIIQHIIDVDKSARIALFAQGDYLDDYVTKHIDFTSDVTKLVTYVWKMKLSYGEGDDWMETHTACYPLVMKEARDLLSWKPESERHLVLIGDTEPHNDEFYDHVDDAVSCERLKWEDEAARLKQEARRL